MANLCCNTVHLIGDKPALDKIVTAYNQITTKCKTLEALQENLGFVCDDWGRSCDDGISFCDFDDETGHLVIDVCTAWGSVDDYWNALKDFLGLEKWISWSELDSEIFVTNDPDCQIFPTQYVLETWDDNDYGIDGERIEFDSEEDALNYLNQKIGTQSSLDDYEELIDDEGWGSLITIERD